MKCITLKNFATAFLLVSSLAIVSCNSDESTDVDAEDTTATSATGDTATNTNLADRAEANISGTYPDTAVTGTATFEIVNGKVKMTLNITAAAKANKTVAVHIHEHPGCGDQGKDAHGHWNPTKANHGKWGSDAY